MGVPSEFVKITTVENIWCVEQVTRVESFTQNCREKKIKVTCPIGLSQCSFLLTTAFEKLPASAKKKAVFFGLQKYA